VGTKEIFCYVFATFTLHHTVVRRSAARVGTSLNGGTLHWSSITKIVEKHFGVLYTLAGMSQSSSFLNAVVSMVFLAWRSNILYHETLLNSETNSRN